MAHNIKSQCAPFSGPHNKSISDVQTKFGTKAYTEGLLQGAKFGFDRFLATGGTPEDSQMRDYVLM